MIGDYYSNKYGQPSLDTNLGGNDDIILLDQLTLDRLKIIKFKRRLSTDDKYDKIIENGNNYFIWAKGD